MRLRVNKHEVLNVGWKSEMKKNIIGVTAAEIGLQCFMAVYISTITYHINK